jgi:DNA-directed RNA polymerase specialized sigma24 family protein
MPGLDDFSDLTFSVGAMGFLARYREGAAELIHAVAAQLLQQAPGDRPMALEKSALNSQAEETALDWEGLWKLYFYRLLRLAQRRLARLPQRAADAEDVALSAFATFCRRAEQGELDVNDSDNLWPLLARITACKAAQLVRHEGRQKRGGGTVRGDSVWPVETEGGVGIDRVLATEPTPEAVIAATEECQRLLAMLGQPLRTVATLKLEGYSNPEIAVRLDVAPRTVERKLAIIRDCWSQEVKAHEQ